MVAKAFASMASLLDSARRSLGPRAGRIVSGVRHAHAEARSWVRKAASALRGVLGRQGGSSSLVNDILSLQLSITGAVGIFALVGLAWTSRTMTDENLSRWAARWTSQLNELGAPLYAADPGSTTVNVERFVATYPEVERVEWYGPDGEPLFQVTQKGYSNDTEQAPLDSNTIANLSAKVGDESPPQWLDNSRADSGHYRLLSPIWTESFVGDGLMKLGSEQSPATELALLGFVAVDLDYAWYESVLTNRLALGSLALVVILGLSWACGRYVLKKALRPLSQLQEPLSTLASGNMQVEFSPSRHEEIQNIIHALRRTTRALGERDRRLSHLATHDSLTGLLNRHAFVQELTREIARLADTGKQSAILFIDLDQFKYINDTCGHPAGDELLRMAARSVQATVRDGDLVARFGGDEFSLLARDVTRKQALLIGEKILQQMALLSQVHDNKVFHLQCSIGIAMVRHSALDAHEYLSQADIACHAAKENGRNRVEIYKASRKENQQMANEIDWIQRIKKALDEDGFVLVYQPLLRISTGWTDHHEVLLRLKSEDDELVSPDAFLPAANRFGLMVDIDHWVLEHAIESLARYRTPRTNLNFSINLSASVFENERFGKHVESLLSRFNVPPESVIFEITEQTAVRFAAESDKRIALLREVGCRFAIDDFGKGYSSFSYLKDLPVDYLKIDGSFVENLAHDEMNQTLVRAMGEVARAARLETIAEYVDSAETLELLGRLGIDYAQGHFIAEPAITPVELEMPFPGSSKSPKRLAREA